MGNKAKIARLKKRLKQLAEQVDRLASPDGTKADVQAAAKPAPATSGRRPAAKRPATPSAGEQPEP